MSSRLHKNCIYLSLMLNQSFCWPICLISKVKKGKGKNYYQRARANLGSYSHHPTLVLTAQKAYGIIEVPLIPPKLKMSEGWREKGERNVKEMREGWKIKLKIKLTIIGPSIPIELHGLVLTIVCLTYRSCAELYGFQPATIATLSKTAISPLVRNNAFWRNPERNEWNDNIRCGYPA